MKRKMPLLLLLSCLALAWAVEAAGQKPADGTDHFKRWLDEDVRYIITKEEEQIYKRLRADEERENFIEQFWRRRDPDPNTPDNEYKLEHYRRIAYANQHFTAGIPLAKRSREDLCHLGRPKISGELRGRRDLQPSHERGRRADDGLSLRNLALRLPRGCRLRYRHRICRQRATGDFRIAKDEYEKDALFYTPNAGLTLAEMGKMTATGSLGTKDDRVRMREMTGDERNAGQFRMDRAQDSAFARLERYFQLNRPPDIKYKDLQALVTTRVTYDLLPVEIRTDLIRVTDQHILVPLTLEIKNRDLSFETTSSGVRIGVVNIYGRVETLNRTIAYEFEDDIRTELNEEVYPVAIERSSVYQKNLP